MSPRDATPPGAVARRRRLLLLVLAVVAATLPATAARADPTLELAPVAGPTGQLVTVDGVDYLPDREVGVFFDVGEFFGSSTPAELRVPTPPVQDPGTPPAPADGDGVVATSFHVPPLDFGDEPGPRRVGACTIGLHSEQCQVLINGFERPVMSFTHLGDPDITLAPRWGQVGQTVTVTGERFSSQGCGPVEVVLDPGVDEQVLATPALESDGPGTSASFTTEVTVPDVDVGGHVVVARQTSTGCAIAPRAGLGVFTFAVNPGTGLAGSDAMALGEGFPAAFECGPVEVAFDGEVVAEVTTTGFPGDPFAVDFEVPARPLGDYAVTGTQGGCGDYLGSDDFTVEADPGIAVEPATGVVGTEALATVSGFPDAAVCGPVAVAFDDEAVGEVEPVDDGAPVDVDLVVPERPTGEYPVTATQDGDGCGLLQASDDFIVSPDAAIAVDPSQGPIETEVEVTGTGFEDGVGVRVSFGDVVATTVLPGAVAEGGFTAETEVPDGIPGGPVVVTACQRCDTPDARVATTDFLVLPRLELDPEVGPPGMAAEVIADGFPAGELQVLDWQPGLGTIEVVADELGVLSASMLVFHHDRLGVRELQTIVDGTPYLLPDPDDGAPAPEDIDLAAEYLVVPGTAQPRDFATRR